MLIDKSYFFGPLSIGQLSEQAVQDKLNWFIQQFEPKYLEGVLGYAAYKQLKADLTLLPIPQRWVDLISGVEFTDETGLLKKWHGLIDNSDALASNNPAVYFKQSPIADYVYYWYQRSQVTTTGGIGESKTDSHNASHSSPRHKMATAWNKMRGTNLLMYDFLRSRSSVYPEWYNWALTDNSNVHFLKTVNIFNI